MSEKEYIMNDFELYEKVSPGVYNLYLFDDAFHKFQTEILLDIIKSKVLKRLNNLIYKDLDVAVVGYFDPNLVWKNEGKPQFQIKYKIPKMFLSAYYYKISGIDPVCVFIKLGFSDEFEKDLYCIYPFGNTYLEEKMVDKLDQYYRTLNFYPWLQEPANEDTRVETIISVLDLEDFVIIDQEDKENNDILNSVTSDEEFVYAKIILDIFDNYYDFVKIDEKQLDGNFSKADFYKSVIENNIVKNVLVNWYILNVLLPKEQKNKKFMNLLLSSKFIVDWKEVITNDYEEQY